MSIFSDLLGTTKAYFKIGISGVRLKNSTGNLVVRNTGDSADAEVTASKVNISGNDLVINSGSAGAGADWKLTLTRPTSGMTADVALTFPTTDGSPNEFLKTDGSGVLSWAAAGDTTLADKLDTTSLAFGTASPVTMFTTGANDVIEYVEVIVDTAFDGTPSASVGIVGTTSKYVASSDIDLTQAAGTKYMIHPAQTAQGAENLIITYAAGGATAGAARFIVHYATPA